MTDTTQTTALVHSPERAAQRLGISTRAVYLHLKQGQLRSFKSGKRRLIPEAELAAFIERKLAEAGAAAAAPQQACQPGQAGGAQ